MSLRCIYKGECTGCGYCMDDEENAVVYKCASCGNEIFEGETYYRVFGDPFCEKCVIYCEAERE